MSQLRAVDLAFSPDERAGMFVVRGGEVLDRLPELFGTAKAGARQGHPAAARLTITGGPFQSLKRRLFVDAEDQRMFRRVQVQADNIGRFGGKLWVGADAPRAMPAQLNAVVAQNAPDRLIRDAEGRGQRTAIPSGQPWRWRQFPLPQEALAQLGSVFGLLARPRLIAQPGDAAGGKSLAPQANRVGPHTKLARHRVIALALQASENNPGTLDKAGFPG